MERSFLRLALGATVVLAPAMLLGQPGPDGGVNSSPGVGSDAGRPATTPSTTLTVQDRVLRALDFFRSHQYAAAIKEFEEANIASPSADFVFNIARANELLAKEIEARQGADPRTQAEELVRYYGAAIENYEKYLRDKVNPPDANAVRVTLEELRQLVQRNQETLRRQSHDTGVQFQVSPVGSAIFLDDHQVGVAPMTTPILTEPGVHRLRITSQDQLEWSAQVRVRQGEVSIAHAVLAPATQFRTISGRHLASYIIGGVGLATILGGAGVGIFAATRPTDAFDCSGMAGGCPRHDTAVVADVLLGLGTAIVVGAVIAYFVEASGSRTERVTPAAPPSVDDHPAVMATQSDPATTLSIMHDAGPESGR